ncbi:colanic acid biosynthesis glycosyltransferase WcaL [Paracoccus subflavus]|uniref:Colanic acid biosynthesis glycosyltransferase WcaL n=1 Tax=Paracoccus subflavus TaxID=2528244 RepID=A0A4Q9FZ21_9RHOB|nr:glycosyltransferase [Paracoccus subflavus]TBN38650.1 colanic acid biosynthesis glycosyltransferase WcaL [Paracoccus subflavus]
MTLGYLVPEFPGQTHAFFWREIRAIEEAGTPVRLYSTRRPPVGSCPHDFAVEAVRRTTYLFPPRVGPATNHILRHPLRAAKAVAYIAGLKQTSAKGKSRLLALLPSAAMLVADAHKYGVTHLHIHSCADAAHLGALAHILGNLPYSLTLHGDLPVYGTDHAAKMKHTRFVAAVTRSLAQQISQISPQTKAPVIWMGVDCDLFVPGLQKVNPVFTVATVARLNHAKGHRFFLRALARLRDDGTVVHYKIAGDGPEQNRITAEIRELGLQDQVEMLGPLDETAILGLLQGVDALALTSIGKGEAAPVTVMEAMSCGLPVICSRIGGTPDMIQHNVDGLLVEQEDVSAIAGMTARLARDPDLCRRIGEAARITALSQFDHRLNARKLLNQIAGTN